MLCMQTGKFCDLYEAVAQSIVYGNPMLMYLHNNDLKFKSSGVLKIRARFNAGPLGGFNRPNYFNAQINAVSSLSSLNCVVESLDIMEPSHFSYQLEWRWKFHSEYALRFYLSTFHLSMISSISSLNFRV